MRTESKYVQHPRENSAVPYSQHDVTDKTRGTTVPVVNNNNNNNNNVDSFNKSNKVNLNNKDKERYNSIYKKIEKICEDNDIDIELAKSFHLIEQLAGVTSEAELIQLDDNTINVIIAILNDSLGWGDGLGFGKKDRNDLTKLVKDIHKKMGYEKTGGSKLGQIWHNVKNKTKKILGLDTIETKKSSEEISEYYQKKYLNNINNVSNDEKAEIYKELLKDFYYDFNMLQDSQKQLQMINAIKNLAADDRLLIIKVIEMNFMHDKNALSLFSKALDINFESIVINQDGYNKSVDKLGATAISHTAYKHMNEEDLNSSLKRNKMRTISVVAEYDNLKKRQANGEDLSPEESRILLLAECYEAKYAGALAGISTNYNIADTAKTTYLSRIANDTEELGIQNSVLETVTDYINKNPDVLLMPKEKFVILMDKITDGKYSKIFTLQDKSINKNKSTNFDVKKDEKMNKEKIRGPNKNEISSNEKEKIIDEKPTDTTSIEKKRAIEPKPTLNNISKPIRSSNIIKRNSLQTLYNEDLLPLDDKKYKKITLKKLEIAGQIGVKEVNKILENSNINEFEATVFLLSMNNLEPNVEKLAFDKFKKWNDSQKSLYCCSIKNNANKIKAGKMIKSTAALSKVRCNNFYVKSEFENILEEKQKLSPNSNTHLSIQKSAC